MKSDRAEPDMKTDSTITTPADKGNVSDWDFPLAIYKPKCPLKRAHPSLFVVEPQICVDNSGDSLEVSR